MDFLKDYINLIILAICLCVGFIIKALFVSDGIKKFIPLIMAVLGIALAIWMNLAFTPEIILTGMISGLSSTGMYELFKNFIEKPDGKT